MRKIKILMTRSLLQVDQDYINENLKNNVGDTFELIAPPSYDEEGISSVADQVEVFLGPFVTEKILMKASKLKLIQVPWTGMDTFNFEAVKGSNVPVCNSHSNAAVVAELCVALLMDLLKKVSYHDRKMRKGNWNRDKKPLNLASKMISDQKICILGYGNIGKKIGKMLSSFGAEIYAVNTVKIDSPEVTKAFSSEQMMDAVAQATVVVNVLPLTELTKGLINSDFISHMRPQSYLVNISRASIIDEDAVYNALVEGKLAGFASDVWWKTPKRGESESWPSNKNKFELLDQIVMSPHRAGFVEGSLPHLDDVIVNLSRFIKGEELINIVDLEKKF